MLLARPSNASPADCVRYDNLVNELRKFVVYLYEETQLKGNGVDWITNFGSSTTQLGIQIRAFFALLNTSEVVLNGIFGDPSSAAQMPDDPELKSWFKVWQDWYQNRSGLGNDLVQEVIDELRIAELSGQGAIADGIAFAHSGFTAPLLTALEREQYDIETAIIYEGPHPNYKTSFTNPHLKRIIHVMGSNHGLANSLVEGDAPVPFLGWAEFTNSANNLENINIEIKGAFHNDFSYNPADYADHTFWDEKKAERQRINRRTNLFMRDLYEAVLKDQTSPNELSLFFEALQITGAARIENNIWKIDPDKLRDIAVI